MEGTSHGAQRLQLPPRRRAGASVPARAPTPSTFLLSDRPTHRAPPPRQSYKAAATKTASLWPSAGSPQPRTVVAGTHRDVRASERDDALRYLLGPTGFQSARERTRGREAEEAAVAAKEAERAEREALHKTVPTVAKPRR